MKMDDKQLKEQQMVASVELMEGWVDPDGNREEDEDACLLITVFAKELPSWPESALPSIIKVKPAENACDVYLLTETYHGYKAGTHVVFNNLDRLPCLICEGLNRKGCWACSTCHGLGNVEPTDDKFTILIDQEYGYTYFKWTINGHDQDEVELLVDAVITDPHYCWCGGPDGNDLAFAGEWTEIDYEEYVRLYDTNQFDASGHFHTADDSHFSFRLDREGRWDELIQLRKLSNLNKIRSEQDSSNL